MRSEVLSKQGYYPCLDIVKYVCCILVLVIHTVPFEFNYWLDGAAGIVTRFANPSFFAISSFLLFNKLLKHPDKDWSILWKQEKRILLLYSVWTVLYLIILLPSWIIQKNMNLDFWFFVKSFMLTGIINYMWFFPALMFGLFITFLLHKFFKPLTILILSVFCLALGVLFSTYLSLVINIPVLSNLYYNFFSIFSAKNGLFFGFPYCAIGLFAAYLSINRSEVLQNFRIRSLVLSIISFIFLCVESLLVTKFLSPNETYLWLSVFPMILFFLLFILTINVKENNLFVIARKMSIFIYCFEYVPITGLNFFFDFIGFNSWYKGICLFFITFVICNVVAYFVYRLSLKKHFTFLRFVY